ncbi:4-oxalocrotonate tautomerase [Sphingomonas kyeonggiensis]|uniref:tautomerase family protein n=1 Tax=Sphingomonas kyeonggiensis TaxID=1268553 RepID=UPI00278B694F|nr:4-oxalocrotonate tautomerase family protein [Sphingomonas kyeonggiensis]MDQ0249197.1 4-oxalocrotonate tautomerase [Sphingomonas kyeonggiensis]
MPIVTIQVTRQGTVPGADRTTDAQKAALYKGVSDLLHQVMGKHPDDTFVVFQEVELEDWGRGGVPVREWFARTRPAGAG